jgi:1,4-alpha-glucan branching enzyme
MKKAILWLAFCLACIPSFSQLLTWTPDFPIESTTPFEIVMDGSKGNGALNFYTPTSEVYVHTGVITNLSSSSSDWKYTRPGNFNTAVPALNAEYVAGSIPYKWKFTITGGIRAYYGITNPSETIQKIAILFRNANGSKVQRNLDGSDMYIPVSDGSLKVKFTTPLHQPTYIPAPENFTKNIGDNIAITAIASSAAAATTMKIYFNGTQIQVASGASTISANLAITGSGTQTIVAEAFDGLNTKTDTLRFFVPNPTVIQALPAGVKDGINYEADNTKATLVLYAPNKTRVTVIGDFPGSNWLEQSPYQMKKTPDGNYWWLQLNGLTPGVEYAFQYQVDGNLKVGEPYTEKVLDPSNDPFISPVTYPGLRSYPYGLTSGLVSILQTSPSTYTWQTNSFSRPDKRNLIVYELLVRDFLAAHDWKTMTDTLNYLKKLGINAIELMPANEFEGNLSWGYNPSYYLAPDKYYGPKNEMKQFIDMAHSKGIAVVLDIALNHSFGLSPMVQLYWDAANSRPAANNPWFNTVTKHAFNVGYDMNHESLATRYFVSRVVTHWLTEYKMDGFRFDLSKGFTQNATCDVNGNTCDEGAMGNYDASRVAIWKRYYDTLQLKSAGSYVILEHFAANIEEIELSNYGMLLWGNANKAFNEASMGWVSTSDFDGALYLNRGFTQPNLVSYMESHDEERLMYKNVMFGNSTASGSGYNVKDTTTALGRMELCASFLLTMPGPKMIWQFGELGYGYPINYCEDGSTNTECRTRPKPIRWDYLQQNSRKKLHDVYSALLQLRANPLYAEAFTTGSINRNFAGAFKWMTINSGAGKLVVIGNFDVVSQTGSVTFPTAGTWYNYLNSPATFAATGGSQSFTLQPGEYRVYLSSNVVIPVTIINFSGRNAGTINKLTWQVANEQNLVHYEVLRSKDGFNFEPIGNVTALGNSSYDFTDTDISKSNVYSYRLKKLDIDGSYTYSQIVKIAGPVKGLSLTATPNPYAAAMKLTIETPLKETAVLIVTDPGGRQLYKQSVNLQAGVNIISVDKLRSLSAGTYILQLVSAQGSRTARVIKIND